MILLIAQRHVNAYISVIPLMPSLLPILLLLPLAPAPLPVPIPPSSPLLVLLSPAPLLPYVVEGALSVPYPLETT
jgi:hypothetical protein